MSRTAKGEALTALILETFRLNGGLLAAGNSLTKPMGMTSARWQVMGAIDEYGRSLTVAQIARRMGLTRQGVQRIINELEKRGLVEFQANLDHKRSPLVKITQVGSDVMSNIAKVQAAWVNELSEGLSEREIRAALKLLETVRDRLEQADTNGGLTTE
ncbi:MAG: helix-turn-helix domain-containing protein [Pseudomonadota bacterium]